jgi:uncharacterized membrane protein YphA (DoxX/SURF4 family)
MKLVSNLAAILLGLVFFVFGLDHFLHFMPQPPQTPPPPGSHIPEFFGALMGTPYLTFVKLFEVLGGALMLIPATRNLALLLLGPIIVNIWCFHIFIAQGAMLKTPMVAVVMTIITGGALLVLISNRKAWAGLLSR